MASSPYGRRVDEHLRSVDYEVEPNVTLLGRRMTTSDQKMYSTYWKDGRLHRKLRMTSSDIDSESDTMANCGRPRTWHGAMYSDGDHNEELVDEHDAPRPQMLEQTFPDKETRRLQCTTPIKWGITYAQWNEVIDHCKTEKAYKKIRASKNKWEQCVNMHEVNSEFVIPWTRGTGCGIALLMNNRGLSTTIMLSHAWSEDMEECQEAVNEFFQEKQLSSDQVLWFCTFSQYQPGDDKGPSIERQLMLDPFQQVIASLSHVSHSMMLAIHMTQADLYERLWCVSEVDEALEANVAVVAVFSEAYKKDFHRRYNMVIKANGSNHDAMEAAGLTVHSARAKCHPRDEQRLIEQVLRNGGFQRIDKAVTEFRQREVFNVIMAANRDAFDKGKFEPLLKLAWEGTRQAMLELRHFAMSGHEKALEKLTEMADADAKPQVAAFACEELYNMTVFGNEQAHDMLNELADQGNSLARNALRELAEGKVKNLQVQLDDLRLKEERARQNAVQAREEARMEAKDEADKLLKEKTVECKDKELENIKLRYAHAATAKELAQAKASCEDLRRQQRVDREQAEKRDKEYHQMKDRATRRSHDFHRAEEQLNEVDSARQQLVQNLRDAEDRAGRRSQEFRLAKEALSEMERKAEQRSRDYKQVKEELAQELEKRIELEKRMRDSVGDSRLMQHEWVDKSTRVFMCRRGGLPHEQKKWKYFTAYECSRCNKTINYVPSSNGEHDVCHGPQ